MKTSVKSFKEFKEENSFKENLKVLSWSIGGVFFIFFILNFLFTDNFGSLINNIFNFLVFFSFLYVFFAVILFFITGEKVGTENYKKSSFDDDEISEAKIRNFKDIEDDEDIYTDPLYSNMPGNIFYDSRDENSFSNSFLDDFYLNQD